MGEIVRRARARLSKSPEGLKPIGTKFLVPFLEKASLEDKDSPLINMWAGLLASAATGGSSYHVHFVSVISQLSQKQGELLEELIGTKSDNVAALAMDRIKASLEHHAVRKSVAQALDELVLSSSTDFDPLTSAIAELMNCVGVEMVFGAVGIGSRENYVEIDFCNGNLYSDGIEVDFSILEAVGLIRRVEVNFDVGKVYSITLEYYHLTSMGYHFAKACGLVSYLGRVTTISFERGRMFVTLDTGRSLRVDLKHFPELLAASSSERKEFVATAISVDWAKLSLSIPIEQLLDLDDSTEKMSS
ncbi:Abi-alpha family protein [Bradyrhizobium guangxiense]